MMTSLWCLAYYHCFNVSPCVLAWITTKKHPGLQEMSTGEMSEHLSICPGIAYVFFILLSYLVYV